VVFEDEVLDLEILDFDIEDLDLNVDVLDLGVLDVEDEVLYVEDEIADEVLGIEYLVIDALIVKVLSSRFSFSPSSSLPIPRGHLDLVIDDLVLSFVLEFHVFGLVLILVVDIVLVLEALFLDYVVITSHCMTDPSLRIITCSAVALSTVLRAGWLSYGKCDFRPHYSSAANEPIKMAFGTCDYVAEATLPANFCPPTLVRLPPGKG